MSNNFEFLGVKRSALAGLAELAEKYAHDDPSSSLIKQRSFVEQIVGLIYTAYHLQPPFSDNLNDLLTTEAFRQTIPEVVQSKLHAVRKAGNYAAHPRRPITSQLSLTALEQLFDVARWFHVQVDGGKLSDTPAFVVPPPETRVNGREALERLRLVEAKYESVLVELEAERKQRLDAERAATTHATQLEQLKTAGEVTASKLKFDEKLTRRRLIDIALVAAGWN
ncbi:MAG TPA: DUF4145 domain-containing protein, partial [Candidatus Paceibacterota bacterium]|nr:DUF4145 domain-containing protein [Candidatus Paceibacterota bacterium]